MPDKTECSFDFEAACHCGAVQLALSLPEAPLLPRRCNCSYCRRRGTMVISVPVGGLRIVQGEEALRLYQFKTNTARHYFCGICGIHTHHRRRSNPGEYSVNVGCIEEIDPFAFSDVAVYDGRNHPADRT